MTRIASPTAVDQLTTAVSMARESRHGNHCRCGLFRPMVNPYKGSPYCTSDEFRWSERIDRLLSAVTQDF